MEKKEQKKQRGYILLETVIAVGVMGVIFAGAMSLFYSSVVGVSISSDELVAIFLAQDLMEQAVAKHQYNTDNFKEWMENFNCGNCTLDTFSNTDPDAIFTSPAGCPANGCQLNRDGNGIYTTSGGSATQFRRKMSITKHPLANADQEVDIEVTVEWDNGPTPMSVTLYHRIYDQQPDTFN